MEDVYLSLGSNIGNRERYLHQAISMLGNDSGILVDKVAHFYETSPVGGVEQRAFLNTAVKIATRYQPEELLQKKFTTLKASFSEPGQFIGALAHWTLILFSLAIRRYKIKD